MVEMNNIIRYIRIFSDLAGQIKYASQKRILVEIALIKLCKPQMEQNQEAILDRIRQVEDKVENGVFVTEEMLAQGGFAGGTGQDGAFGAGNAAPGEGGNAAGAVRRPKPELPNAIPEDVQEIVRKWPSIVGNAGNPMKMYLKGARLSLGGDNRLMVVLEDGLASDYFNQRTENKEYLENMLSQFSGKKIEVNIQTVKNQREFEDTYVDLSHVINMDIEEEDDI
jgi:DNA polymerase-3 subunit gamma/tau